MYRLFQRPSARSFGEIFGNVQPVCRIFGPSTNVGVDTFPKPKFVKADRQLFRFVGIFSCEQSAVHRSALFASYVPCGCFEVVARGPFCGKN